MIPVNVIIPQIRQHIRDADKTIVADDATFYPFVLAAVRRLHNDIPEMALDENLDVMSIPTQLSDGDDELPITDAYIDAVAYFATHVYYLGDIGSVRDERRSNEFLNAYEREIAPMEK
jgi:hypothetical protein